MEKERSYCRYCGERWLDNVLSNRGVCPECAQKRQWAAITQMQAHFGPIYDKWRIAYVASMVRVLERLRKEQEQDVIPL